MALIDHIDGLNRDIYLSASTVGVSVNPIDIYKEMRTLRHNNEDLRKYNVFLTAYGHVPKSNGKYTERYVMEMESTRIIPYDTSHTLTVIGTIITDDGQEGVDCFDRTPLSSTTRVDINYEPPQVEIIEVNTGSGITPQDKMDIVNGVWNELFSGHMIDGSYSALVQSLISILKLTGNKVIKSGDTITIYENDGVTIWKQFDLANGGRIEI